MANHITMYKFISRSIGDRGIYLLSGSEFLLSNLSLFIVKLYQTFYFIIGILMLRNKVLTLVRLHRLRFPGSSIKKTFVLSYITSREYVAIISVFLYQELQMS